MKRRLDIAMTLVGDPRIGHNGWLAVAWCVGLTVLGYFWATSKFDQEPR